MEERLARIEDMVTQLIHIVGSTNAMLEELRQDVNGLRKDVNGLRKDVDDLRKDVDDLHKDVDSLRQEVHEMREEFNQRFRDIENQLEYFALKIVRQDVEIREIKKRLA